MAISDTFIKCLAFSRYRLVEMCQLFYRTTAQVFPLEVGCSNCNFDEEKTSYLTLSSIVCGLVKVTNSHKPVKEQQKQ